MNDKNQTETIKKGRFTITKNKNTLNSDLKDIKIPTAREIFIEEKKSIREIFKEEGIDYSQEKEFHSNISDKLDKRFKKPEQISKEIGEKKGFIEKFSPKAGKDLGSFTKRLSEENKKKQTQGTNITL